MAKIKDIRGRKLKRENPEQTIEDPRQNNLTYGKKELISYGKINFVISGKNLFTRGKIKFYHDDKI